MHRIKELNLCIGPKTPHFSLCMGFYETTSGILQSVLAGAIFKKVEVAQKRALLTCGKREMHFDEIIWILFT